MKNSGEVGARIRRMRRAAGMSQAEVAGDDLSASYISLLEAGKRAPSADVLAQLARRLGCDPSDLTGAPAEISVNELQLSLNYAEMALNSGDPDASFEAYRTLQEKVGFVDRPEVWHQAEYGMARSLEHGGRLEEAADRFESLLTASLDRPDLVPRLPTAIALCRCYRRLGDLSRAIEVAESTLADLEKLQLGPTVIGIELLCTLVGVYMERGDLRRAARLAAQVIEQTGTVTHSRALGAAYWNASVVMHRNGNTADALTLIEKALAIYAEGEDQRALARLRNAYAMLLPPSETAQPEVARDVPDQSLTSLRGVGSGVDVAYCLSALVSAEHAVHGAPGDLPDGPEADVAHGGKAREEK
ncbi:helix-turn-helix domain-containing protein [Streptomyces sp. NPDC019937]|uniref:helix-turn-helix domain-containing protein n=1 Tax=Streptomyces sp. NPDC019937 TaxID=3154787 RepID=UPI0034114138